MQQTVRVDFQAAKPWRDPLSAIELIDILHKFEDVGLAPQRYGSSTARTFELSQYSEEQIHELWSRVGGGVLKASTKWECLYHIFFLKAPRPRGVSSFWIRIHEEFFRDQRRSEKFIDLCREVYAWGQMDHGFIAHADEYEMKNSLGNEAGVGGANLRRGLPGIYWVNLFGPNYVQWLGPQKFHNLQGFVNQELSDGGWLVHGRDDLFDFRSKSSGRHEHRLLKHLGSYAFFERRKRTKHIQTPSLWVD